MRALRIVLTQRKAHYRKEESLQNKMTYPLPPFSTVIGAIHSACGFKEYQPMDLSIQGNYQSLSRQPYTDHSFLDSVMDDRGILVKMKSSTLLSSSFDKVASALKSQGNSFKNNVTINIHDRELMEEYWKLKQMGDEIQQFKSTRLKKVNDLFKKRKKSLAEKKKKFDKKSKAFAKLVQREAEIKAKEKEIKDRFQAFEYENYKQPISLYQSLTTSLKYYEILHEVKLIIHVKADDDILTCIRENIYNLKSLGRSEDFVDVESCEFVELNSEVEEDIESEYSAYLNADLVKRKEIRLTRKDGVSASGTKYWINKVYHRENGYRAFEKVKVVYASNYFIDEDTAGVFYDSQGYIVDFN
jgi:CRISPR-associated protein Cas5t